MADKGIHQKDNWCPQRRKSLKMKGKMSSMPQYILEINGKVNMQIKRKIDIN